MITGKTFKAKIYSLLSLFKSEPNKKDVPSIVDSITVIKVFAIFSKIFLITGTFKILIPIIS